LTRLVDLRLGLIGDCSITAGMLSGAQHLTRLELTWGSLEPAALAGKTRLQHLHLTHTCADAAATTQLLFQLQQLQQLTCLLLVINLHSTDASPPASAFSALTASSKLQRLDISYCTLPPGVWQCVFPAGRQLPHLQSLRMTGARFPTGPAAAPEGTRLASCCPGLQSLNIEGLQYSKGLLGSLQGLSCLHVLHLKPVPGSSEEGWAQGMYQLTALRDLHVEEVEGEGLLLQLTQLRQLTCLDYSRRPAAAVAVRDRLRLEVSNCRCCAC
jgi:hypothetical protein